MWFGNFSYFEKRKVDKHERGLICCKTLSMGLQCFESELHVDAVNVETPLHVFSSIIIFGKLLIILE